MRVIRCVLREIRLPLRTPMRTSYGTHADKHAILVSLESADGVMGVAECVAMWEPTYTEETVQTAWHMLADFLVPTVRGVDLTTADSIRRWLSSVSYVRGNHMAKAGLEMALWDLLSAQSKKPLHEWLGGTIREGPVGISLGIKPNLDDLVRDATTAVELGYQRIKLKIEPGYDYEPLAAIRRALPNVPLMADANSAYSSNDVGMLRSLDGLRLEMIEQPLAFDDMLCHADLQRQLQTPICLDESIRSAADAVMAVQLGAARVINLKPGRVGGFIPSLQIHDVAVRNGMRLWCGGMYETGIGRLHNLALLSLPGFNLATDNGPSERYFHYDIISPPVTFSRPGYLGVEPLCGVADRVDWDRVEACTTRLESFDILN